MLRYYDLNVEIDINNDFNSIAKNLLFYKDLGYYGLGIVYPLNKIKEFNDLRRSLEDDKFKLYSRINIKAKNIQGLKSILKNIRTKYDLIAIECFDINTAHWAIQDSRPDIIVLNDFGINNYGYSTAKLLSNNNKALELSLKSLIRDPYWRKSKFLRVNSKIMQHIIKAKSYFIITTNSKAGHIYYIRAPRDLMTLLYLLDVPENIAKKSVSEFPEKIILQALDKKNPNIISKNIRVINNRGNNGE
ncbi:MAG: RNase P subunit p30 family protein [Candidatus Helarchaeota archaeon]